MSLRDVTLFVCLLAVMAAAPQAGPKPVASYAGIVEYRLENGLRVVLAPDDNSGALTVALVYLTGSRLEGPGQFGIAHLMEHVMFTGTARHPDLLGEFGRRGARPNAFTVHDATVFHQTLPAGDANLAWALAIEADRMVNVRVNTETVAKERAAVLQEMAVMGGDPRRMLYEGVLAAAYQWHGYGRSPVGNRSDVESIGPELLERFYREHYRPSNAVLILGGTFERRRAMEIVRSGFGAIPDARASAAQAITGSAEPPQPGHRALVVHGAAAPMAQIAYHVPAVAHADRAAVHVLAETFAGPGGLLHTAARPGGIGYELARTREAGTLMFSTTLPPEATEADLRTFEARLDDAVSREISRQLIDQARQRALASIAAADRTSASLVHDLAEWVAAGDWRLRYLYKGRLEQVDEAAIADARRYLVPQNRTAGILLPASSRPGVTVPAAAELAAALKPFDEPAAPVAGAAPADSIESGRLPNGLRYAIRLRPRPDASASAYLFLHFGTVETLHGRGAVGAVTARAVAGALRTGPAAERLAALGVKATASGRAYSFFVSLDGPGPRLPEAIAVVGATLRRPGIDAATVERARKQELQASAQRGADMSQEALRRLTQAIARWPSGHVLHAGSAQDATVLVSSVTLADVSRFHTEFYGASAAEFVATGSLHPADVIGAISAALGSWSARAAFAPIPPPRTFGSPVVERVAWPAAAGAIVMAGLPVPLDEEHPDHAPLLVANQLLGGGFYGALLPSRIRGEAGAAYRVASIVHAAAWGDETRRFEITVMCAADQVPRVIDLVRAVLTEARERPRPADEVIAARDGLLQAERLAATRDARWLSRTAHDLHKGRGLGSSDRIEAAIARVTPADVHRVMRAYLDPARLTIVAITPAGGN